MSVENVSQVAAAPAAPPSVDTSEVMDFGQRQHMIIEAARAETLAAEKAEAQGDEVLPEGEQVVEEVKAANEDDGKPQETAKTEPAKTKTEPSAEEKARKAALVNAARLEREAVKRSTELANKAAELKAKEQAFAEREAKISVLEKAFNDPEALLNLLSEKVTPEKMSEFFIEAGQPEKVAERRAKQAQEPISAEIKKLQDELQAWKKQAEETKAAAQAQATRAETERQFAARVLELKSDVPAASRLLQKRPQEFFAMADMAAKTLMAAAEAQGRHVSWDDVILDVNKQLVDFARDLQDEAPKTPVTPSSPDQTKPSAAAKANTVSNRAASERSTIVNDDDDGENLSFDERVQRVMKRARLG